MDIKELAKNLGLETEEYMELIELFIDRGISDLNELQSAVETGDAEKAAEAAHSIKGASGNLGLMEFYELAGKTEENARGGLLDRVPEALHTLKQGLERLSGIAGI